jgi:hypothetical protein
MLLKFAKKYTVSACSRFIILCASTMEKNINLMSLLCQTFNNSITIKNIEEQQNESLFVAIEPEIEKLKLA